MNLNEKAQRVPTAPYACLAYIGSHCMWYDPGHIAECWRMAVANEKSSRKPDSFRSLSSNPTSGGQIIKL